MKGFLTTYIYRSLLLLLVVIASGFGCSAQELNCQVEFNTEQLQATNKSVFETLKESVTSYMNENHFTNLQYATNERIDCRMYFTFTDYTDDKMTGTLQMQVSRPVYNTNYTTTLFNFKDSKIEFEYSEGTPLTLNLTTMESQLTAILNFYAYLFIAIDCDSFAPLGGQAMYDQLAQIVQQAQSSGESGWKAFEDKKNRSAVLAAFTDPATSVLRQMYYDYHRTGLDEMALSPDKGRAKITSTLEGLTKIYESDGMSVGLSIFKDSKLDELVNIYTQGTQAEREKVVEILTPIYPTEMKRINMIKAGTNKEQ
jgi:hypothetical protein